MWPTLWELGLDAELPCVDLQHLGPIYDNKGRATNPLADFRAKRMNDCDDKAHFLAGLACLLVLNNTATLPCSGHVAIAQLAMLRSVLI